MTAIRVTVANSVVRVTQADGTQVRVINTRGASVRVSNLGLQGIPGPRLVEVVYSVAGLAPSNRTVTGYLATAPITFIPADALAIAGTANTGAATLTILDLSSNVLGTVSFADGATTGTVTISAFSLIKGQGLKFFHPSTINTLADLVVTLPANRGN